MKEIIIISGVVAALSILGVAIAKRLSPKRFWNNHIGPICLIAFFVSLIFGLILLPALEPVSKKYVEITNHQGFISRNGIVVYLPDSETKFVKFDSYKAVTSFRDSTKIFEEQEKIYYNVTVYSHIEWSNPPYTTYNPE